MYTALHGQVHEHRQCLAHAKLQRHYIISGGKIAEQWIEFDSLSMLQQLGAVPSQT
jgi:hypothetical protein